MYAAPKLLGHLGLEIQKIRNKSNLNLSNRGLKLVRKIFLESLLILGHPGLWFQKFEKSFKFETQPQTED